MKLDLEVTLANSGAKVQLTGIYNPETETITDLHADGWRCKNLLMFLPFPFKTIWIKCACAQGLTSFCLSLPSSAALIGLVAAGKKYPANPHTDQLKSVVFTKADWL